MPQVGMSDTLEEEVAILRLNRGWGATRIQAHLKEREFELGEPLPSTSAITRRIAKVDALSPSEKLHYREVRWPESFGGPDLPWESAAAVLELTRKLGREPLVPLAVWYWRATLALPGGDLVEQRCRLAVHAAMGDSQPNRAEVFTSIHTALLAGDIPSGVHGDQVGATDLILDASTSELLRRATKGIGR